MSGSLVRRVTALSAIGYGINILEQTPPSPIAGVRTDKVGVVGDFPWGPANELTDISTVADLFETFCPPEFDAADDYAAMKAFLNKTFVGGLKICRIDATSAAKATSGGITAGTGTITIAAKYKGALGNSISYQFVAASDADAAKRDLIIAIGTRYSARYKNLTFGAITTDVDDPFVDITSAAPSAMPATMGSATALTTGADGTAVATDYVGSGSSAVGIRKFYSESVDVAVLFVAECPDSLVATVNTGLEAYATECDKGMVVLCTPDDATSAETITDVASYRDDRIVYPYPRVKTTNFYDADLDEVEVDGNAFVAAAIVGVDPEVSPGGKPGSLFLQGITGLENPDISRSTYDDLKDAGVAAFQITTALGPIIRGGVTTSITAGLTQIYRRRMTDYITLSIAQRAEQNVGLPLDLDLAGQALGPYTQPLIAEINSFLQGLKDASRIQDYEVDAFSQNTLSSLALNRWVIGISVRLNSAQDEIVFAANIGETVEIAE
jgi:hypothetical protein